MNDGMNGAAGPLCRCCRVMVLLCVAAGCVACGGGRRTSYQVTDVEGRMIEIDGQWDREPDAEAVALLQPYKEQVDKAMSEVVAHSAVMMDRVGPESLLSNLVADVLRMAAHDVLGKPVDMGLVNLGGLRNDLPAGPITVGNIYEVLPFENSLCILTLKGETMKRLFTDIAACGGAGVSGVKLVVSRDRKLLEASIDGRPVEDGRLYTVATIDYLAEGNDGMTSLLQAEKWECPEGAVMRKLFMDYARRQAAAGKMLTSRIEGRMTIMD